MRPQVLLPLKRRLERGMCPEQFHLLEEGDIIKGVKPNGAYRKILRVGKNKADKTYYIELLKLRPSWTRSPNTLYCPGDASQFVPVKVKNERIWDFTYEKVQGGRLRAQRLRINRMRRQLKEKLKKYEALG